MEVNFTHEDQVYNGYLKFVKGAYGDTWHLYLDNIYHGRLRIHQKKWVFDPSAYTWLKDFVEYFSQVVLSSKSQGENPG